MGLETHRGCFISRGCSSFRNVLGCKAPSPLPYHDIALAHTSLTHARTRTQHSHTSLLNTQMQPKPREFSETGAWRQPRTKRKYNRNPESFRRPELRPPPAPPARPTHNFNRNPGSFRGPEPPAPLSHVVPGADLFVQVVQLSRFEAGRDEGGLCSEHIRQAKQTSTTE